MNKLTTVLLCLIFYLIVTGFSFGKFLDDMKYKGTNIGVMNCVKENTPDETGIGKNKIKQLCVKKHEKLLKPSPPTAMTGRYSFTFGFIYFEVELENKSKDFVITRFDVVVKHVDNKDEKGKQITEIIKFNNIWILPGEKKNLVGSELKFLPNTDRFNSVEKDEETKWLFTFGVNSYKGVKVVLR